MWTSFQGLPKAAMPSPTPSRRRYPKHVSDDVYQRSVTIMGTVATIQVVGHGADPQQKSAREQIREQTVHQSVDAAFAWFERVEECCSRFEPRSELMQLVGQVGVAVPASAILYEAVQFALAVAAESGGAFDPTVGYAMESRGFNREYRSGEVIRTDIEPEEAISYLDVHLDPEEKTITLLRPLILDLGAVAKGLAVDLAARELRAFENFAINAGGDLYLGGSNPNGAPWAIGIRHPRRDHELIETIRVSNRAVCTSGDYERLGRDGDHHIMDPRTGTTAPSVASATVVAPTAMLADALATAAFVLGPQDGIRLLDRLGVEGLIFSPTLERYATQDLCSDH